MCIAPLTGHNKLHMRYYNLRNCYLMARHID